MQVETNCCYYLPQNHCLSIEGAEMLTEQQLNLFNKNGFLIVDHVLDDEGLLPLQREHTELLDSLARERIVSGEYKGPIFKDWIQRKRGAEG